MCKPTKHSVPEGILKLYPGEWRLIILFRHVCERNQRQAEHHLNQCNNVDSFECHCYKIE